MGKQPFVDLQHQVALDRGEAVDEAVRMKSSMKSSDRPDAA